MVFKWAVALKNLTMLRCGGMWKTMEVWNRKEVECSMQNLMDHSTRSLEENIAKS